MTDGKGPSNRHSAFFDLERNPERDALTRPASMLRGTEWGGLTLVSLLAGLAFPPYFFSVMALAFLNAGGMLWVTHLNEAGRKRLREFEAEFAHGHALEEKGEWRAAVDCYVALAPHYADQSQIASIALHRIEHLKATHPEAFPRQPKNGRKLASAPETALTPKTQKPKAETKTTSVRPAKAVLRRKPA